jgi:hypothetical protein
MFDVPFNLEALSPKQDTIRPARLKDYLRRLNANKIIRPAILNNKEIYFSSSNIEDLGID